MATLELILIFVLQSAAVTGQNRASFYVRVGAEFTLPCENVIPDPDVDKCYYTFWVFNHYINTNTVELVSNGQIASNEFAEAKAARLNVPDDCSLTIKKVTDEDVGLYTCQQNDRGQTLRFFLVYLSLVNTVIEQKDENNVMLSCSVVTVDGCSRVTLMWLYEGMEVKTNIRNIQTSQSACRTTVSFVTSDYVKKRFQCGVTDANTQPLTMQKFDVTSLSSGRKTTTEETGPPIKSTAQDWWPILVGLLSALIITVVVLVVCWKRTRGNQTEVADDTASLKLSQTAVEDDTVLTSVNTANPAVKQSGPGSSQNQSDQTDGDGPTYASINHSHNEKKKKKKKKSADKAQVNGGDEDVTYSTVKPSSSSPGDATDPSSLYATVNKPRK